MKMHNELGTPKRIYSETFLFQRALNPLDTLKMLVLFLGILYPENTIPNTIPNNQ